MALDLYAGPLSRYHAANWKNIGQQIAELQGVSYQLIQVGNDEEKASPEEVTRAIIAWQNQLVGSLQPQGIEIDTWPEGQELEYLTDRPGWEGFLALIVMAHSLIRPESKLPSTLPPLEELWQHPANQEDQGDSPLGYLSGVELWLPGDFREIISLETPVGKPVLCASVGRLLWFLGEVCAKWGLDTAALDTRTTDQPGPGSSFEGAAIHGLVTCWRLGKFAQERRVPLVLDY